MRTRPRWIVVSLSALALALAGCGGAESTSDSASVAAAPSTTEPTPSSEPTAAPATTAPTTAPGDDPDTGDAGGSADAALPPVGTAPTESAGFPTPPADETAFLDEVELGRHDGYDRVVFTFTSDEQLPAWRAEYVDEVRQDGSGNLVDVAGDEALSVTMSGASGVDLSAGGPSEIYTGPDRIDGGALQVVEEVVQAGDFEATMSWALGLEDEQPFRVFTLTDPARVVVDVMTEG